MAKNSTSFSEGKQPDKRRGRSKRTLILESIKEKSLLSVDKDSSTEDCEKAFFGHILDRAVNPEDQNSAMLLKTLLDKGWASAKSSMENQKFSLDRTKPLDDQASQILVSVSEGEIPPDVGVMMINAITNMLKIKEVTDLEERIKALEADEDE
ncbi:MAG: hypothetical protein GY782_07215 [Gammaproteobacteria bacterium]|nr:hypothetical protein [Gammaproteobacteria bacterium]